MMSNSDFVGQGFAFPMGLNHQGEIQMVSGSANVERSIQLIIGTAYGERPMRPDFGCGIHDLVFEVTSVELLSQIRVQVRSSLRRWETRADILNVNASFANDPSLVEISITYRLKGNYDPRNLLVPFYVIPQLEEQ